MQPSGRDQQAVVGGMVGGQLPGTSQPQSGQLKIIRKKYRFAIVVVVVFVAVLTDCASSRLIDSPRGVDNGRRDKRIEEQIIV